MHEEAVWRDLLGKIDEVARAQAPRRVTRVRLWVGALCHLSEAHLRSDWDRRTRGTLAESSDLEIVVSKDLHDPRAQGLVITSLDVDG